MKVRGLDGRMYNIQLSRYLTPGDRPHSSLHVLARGLLRTLFPNQQILEEVFLPGLPTASYADFYLPLPRLLVEVQGEQHDMPDHWFHGGRSSFLRARGRDLNKRRWCELNDIILVELPCGEDASEWARRINAFPSLPGGEEGG